MGVFDCVKEIITIVKDGKQIKCTKEYYPFTNDTYYVLKCPKYLSSALESRYGKKYGVLLKTINECSVDYLIYKPDTVSSYDYTLTYDNSIKSILNKTQNELITTKEELANTKKELEHTKYELSQRSNPNRLINGDFQVWQRGETFTTVQGTTYYTSDRWSIASISSTTPIVKRGEKGCVISFPADSTHNTRFHQLIEDGYKLNGKIVTISFCAKSLDLNIRKVGVQLCGKLNFSKICMKKEVELSQCSKVYTLTVNVPDNSFNKDDIVAVAFGLSTHVGDYYGLTSTYTAPQGDGVEFEWVKLELGEYATPFIPRSYQEELSACQRYYYKPIKQDEWYNGFKLHGSSFVYFDSQLSSMRVIPSVIFDAGNTKIYTDDDGWVDLKFKTVTSSRIIYENLDSLKEGCSYLITNMPSYDAEIY